MRSLRLVIACLLLPAAACHIEDRTPTGSRRDEDAVVALLSQYARSLSEQDWNSVRGLFWRGGSYSGPMVPRSVGQAVPIDSALAHIARRVDGTESGRYDVRILRTDFRQDGDVAAAWVTTRRLAPVAGTDVPVERDWVEHLVLRRIGNNWRILSVAGATTPRGGPRER
ncbi:MAG TPA: hypothetical protein VEB59_05980 [Gemmatimonadales bacterium]|nr:hypothetical protein [Gemmatimonadales bacterium]